MDDHAQVLMRALLQVDPAQRATAAQVARHPWVLGLPPPSIRIVVDARGLGPAAPHPLIDSAADKEDTLHAMQHLLLHQPISGAPIFIAYTFVSSFTCCLPQKMCCPWMDDTSSLTTPD